MYLNARCVPEYFWHSFAVRLGGRLDVPNEANDAFILQLSRHSGHGTANIGCQCQEGFPAGYILISTATYCNLLVLIFAAIAALGCGTSLTPWP